MTLSLPSQKESLERDLKYDSVHKNSIEGVFVYFFFFFKFLSFFFILLSHLHIKAFQLLGLLSSSSLHSPAISFKLQAGF